MVEYDIYLPTTRNGGGTIDDAILDQVKHSLADAFGGYTHFKQHNEGAWRIGGVTFRDEVTVVRVLDDGSSSFHIGAFKRNLEDWLEQENVLIVSRQVSVVAG